MMVNWFDTLSKRLLNEIILLMKCAQKVLFPPQRGHGSTRMTESVQIWRNQESAIKQQVSQLRDQGETGDQVLIIAKIMNMKDKLMQ
mmetsp:Transcript_11692/g.15871  ORF Transcript_11692/g.15871 Transcript_11692/m.15871 type:complete len:87 (+) Transcript_11692:256-516(+)